MLKINLLAKVHIIYKTNHHPIVIKYKIILVSYHHNIIYHLKYLIHCNLRESIVLNKM